jgi:hypothetical protein
MKHVEGCAAQYRARQEEASRLFDEAERLALPAGNYRAVTSTPILPWPPTSPAIPSQPRH